ncbi:MAG: signal peptidase I [Peptococcaceae bacterium]|nr:MAG: signal peptidase I [Peptococcaceae bacterium]
MDQVEQGELQNDSSEQEEGRKRLLEMLKSLLIAVVLAILIRMFVMEPFFIPSASMVPNLQVRDRIIVSKVNYLLREPQRGDVIVFPFPKNPSRNFVKRLIAVGGETVALRDNHLYINGRVVPENYLPKGITFQDYGPVTVPEGNYFVLGDNRNNSEDSRYWNFLPADTVIGKAVVIYWPVDRIRFIR